MILLLIYSNPWLANFIVGRMETPSTVTLPAHVNTGVVLGGMLDTSRPEIEFTESADRFIIGLLLLKQNSITRVVWSGGSGDILREDFVEAESLAETAQILGVPMDQMLLEVRSRNTYENARYTRELIQNTDSIVLVTSAFHMTRAMACFEKQGFAVVPYPVDYRQSQLTGWEAWMPSLDALQDWERINKETLGYVVYWLKGYL